MNTKTLLLIASFFAFSAVLLGALGAHALKESLEPAALESFKTGVRYQAWHALALLFLALAQKHGIVANTKGIGLLFTLGVVFFSFSIYFLSTRAISNLTVNWLGPITPIGGLLLMTGWALLFVSIWRSKSL
jgi:uncharacterized membrane protein YgdD (TMEM256/DUF423 family)